MRCHEDLIRPLLDEAKAEHIRCCREKPPWSRGLAERAACSRGQHCGHLPWDLERPLLHPVTDDPGC
jgi:hypothetical protein